MFEAYMIVAIREGRYWEQVILLKCSNFRNKAHYVYENLMDTGLHSDAENEGIIVTDITTSIDNIKKICTYDFIKYVWLDVSISTILASLAK